MPGWCTMKFWVDTMGHNITLANPDRQTQTDRQDLQWLALLVSIQTDSSHNAALVLGWRESSSPQHLPSTVRTIKLISKWAQVHLNNIYLPLSANVEKGPEIWAINNVYLRLVNSIQTAQKQYHVPIAIVITYPHSKCLPIRKKERKSYPCQAGQ